MYFLQNFLKALCGKVVQPVELDKFGMARRLLEGEALATFNLETAQRSEVEVDEGLGPIGEMDIVFDAVIAAMTKQIFSLKALQTQKRYMRRFLRKPSEMGIRKFVSRVLELNSQMKEYPVSNPGEIAGGLPVDEILSSVRDTAIFFR